jgi:hypothetical protein
MKHEYGWRGGCSRLWLQEFGMNSCATDTGKIKMEAVGGGMLELGRDEFNLGINGVHFVQAVVPEFIIIGRTGIGALVGL